MIVEDADTAKLLEIWTHPELLRCLDADLRRQDHLDGVSRVKVVVAAKISHAEERRLPT